MSLTFDEARARLLADPRLLSAERVPLALAAGRVLAESLTAAEPIPRFDYSAMDGYAVAVGDLRGGGPWSIAVGGESRAGSTPARLAENAACRIFTGGPVPERADAVVMQENVSRRGDTMTIDARPKAGQNIRRAGEDVPSGATVLPAGTRMTPGALALAAMLDRAELIVTRRPQVTILCTGDELRVAGAGERGPGLISESNSAPLAALARQAGASVRVAPIVRDDPEATRSAIEQALDGTDVLLTVGGVSVGDHDVVRPALERAGVVLQFWKVAIKPGKPIAVGRLGDRLSPEPRSPGAHVLGLPGNPASAMVTFALFGMPLLRAMQGDLHPCPMMLVARLAASRKRSPDRLEFARAVLARDGDALVAHLHDNQASGAATSLAQSDGLALVAAGNADAPAGTMVDVVRWSDT